MKKLQYNCIIVFLVMLLSACDTFGQTTPPSCVITAPHSNAYYKQGTDVEIRVYASTAGGSFQGGDIDRVEFLSDTVLLGETTMATSNSYSFVWDSVPEGTYRITARAYDSNGNISTSAGVIVKAASAEVSKRGMSACKGKYVGNIIAGSVRSDFTTYWNAVTSENAMKWGVLEQYRNTMNWTSADLAYNHAKNNNIPFRYHVIAWGSQYPSWISSLQPAEFQAEMEQLMSLVSQRYPLIDQVEVLNEAMYINTWNGKEHAAGTPLFRAGLGGPGATGYDWAIWLFEKARQYFPDSKLVLNDFEMETNQAGVQELLNMIKVLRDRNLIDGFGTQAHTFNVDNTPANTIQSALNLMATSGLPIYVTELDLKGTANPVTEASQLASYQKAFPVYWNHPAVAGISLWGYVQGTMWQPDAFLLMSNGTERTALTWLKSYLADRPNIGYPCCPAVSTVNTGPEIPFPDRQISIYPNPLSTGKVFVHFEQAVYSDVSITVYNQIGQMLFRQTHEPSVQYEIDLAGNDHGLYLLHISTDDWFTVKRVVMVR
ncbi:MAG: endo-1,4-beta-xylanase [Bacteroidales bacterium]